jgi:hypothetical protein
MFAAVAALSMDYFLLKKLTDPAGVRGVWARIDSYLFAA